MVFIEGRRIAGSCAVIPGAGQEGDALQVALHVQVVLRHQQIAEIMAAVGCRGIGQFAAAEGGADHVGQIVVDDLGVTVNDGAVAQIGDVVEDLMCAGGGAERHLSVEGGLVGRVVAGIPGAAGAINVLDGDGGNGDTGVEGEALKVDVDAVCDPEVVEFGCQVGGIDGGGHQDADGASRSSNLPGGSSRRGNSGEEGGKVVGLSHIVGVVPALGVAEPVAGSERDGLGGQTLGMHVANKMRREAGDHCADGNKLSRQGHLVVGGALLDFAVCHTHVFNVRGKQGFHVANGALDLDALGVLLDYSESAGLEPRLDGGEGGRTGTEFGSKLGRCKPLVIAGRGWICLVDEELVKGGLIGKRQENTEVR